MVVFKVVSSDLCNTERFERFFLFYRLCQRVRGPWLALAETKHIFETLPVPFSAVAGNRVVYGVDHRVVNAKSCLFERKSVLKVAQVLVTVQGPVADYPDDDTARLCFCSKAAAISSSGK